MLNLSAYLNQRFQFTYNVQSYAAIYSNLASAAWHFQVRPAAGSPVVLLDFQTGGSSQNPSQGIAYLTGPPAQVVVTCPTAQLLGIPAATCVFDFGFVLPGCDFERVSGGSIQFNAGVTVLGSTGNPPAPAGADDTVLPV